MNKEELAMEYEAFMQSQAAAEHRRREESESRLEAEAVGLFGYKALGPWAPLLLVALELKAEGFRNDDPIDALSETPMMLILRCLTIRSAKSLEQLAAATSAMISWTEGAAANRELLMLVATHRANRGRSKKEKTYLHELPGYENSQKQYRNLRDIFHLDIPSRKAHRPPGSPNIAH
jgi:hypothetical protein